MISYFPHLILAACLTMLVEDKKERRRWQAFTIAVYAALGTMYV